MAIFNSYVSHYQRVTWCNLQPPGEQSPTIESLLVLLKIRNHLESLLGCQPEWPRKTQSKVCGIKSRIPSSILEVVLDLLRFGISPSIPWPVQHLCQRQPLQKVSNKCPLSQLSQSTSLGLSQPSTQSFWKILEGSATCEIHFKESPKHRHHQTSVNRNGRLVLFCWIDLSLTQGSQSANTSKSEGWQLMSDLCEE